ncbi:MAG: GNAT family N-acetyltransferase, partial [Bacteroidota bacterium]
MDVHVLVADNQHLPYAEEICLVREEAAKARGTGIAKRDPEYIRKKIREGKAIIALGEGQFAGFCYIETWG